MRAKISTYQTAEVAKQQEAADKLAKDIAKGRVSLDEASTALSAVQGPEAKVTTALGSVGFRAIQTLKITNAKLVPEKYWVIDESTLLADLKAGKKVKGATIEIIQSPINRR